MKSVIPLVRDGICVDLANPIYAPMAVDSEIWLKWLRELSVVSFHYESDSGKFTARREERSNSTNDYWYAYRKIKGKLRKVYLGSRDELTGDRLEQVAVEISQSGEDYFYSRPRYVARKQQSCVVEPDGRLTAKQLDLVETLNNSYAMDNIALSSQVAELKEKLEAVESQLQRLMVENAALKQLL